MNIFILQTLRQNLELDPEGIKDLAMRIQQVVASLVNVDDIIETTKDDLERVKQLKERANRAKYEMMRLLS